ncbi:MAG: hypothetical protein JNK30_22320 [Phenylobacterium sp.]|uniref:hypothetical protein n=1 Tax=Phenylobacterium sp. TaxID=1871053 RepID=UPI001A47F88B|nr:hypothetical protein [Phenylobacterium sp.]MBL8774140.1 hypothetical protein [Phenylobacterium sp.]
MNRTFALIAAAALIAGPASAQTATVVLAGKSSAQIQADIAKAARKVCSQAVVGATFPREMYASCYEHAVRDAVARLAQQTPAPTQVAAQD